MSEVTSENNKRIAKNTVYLYFRMLITLFVGLFTSRVVINALGISDYGIYNVVGGVIGMMGFFNSLLYQGSYRFLTYHLGRNERKELKKTFSACLTIHALLSGLILILGETIGLWFVSTQLNIPVDRHDAALWVYQFSLFSAVLGIMQSPYTASVIAHERMSIYAYMSIFDVLVKLLIVFLLLVVDTDKLILYAFFYFCVTLLDIIIYRIYCIRKFEECSFTFGFDKRLYKEVFNYVGWNSIGTFALLANAQCLNILLNIFFGTVVNAARGIAVSVSGIVNQFVSNFQTAVNPQVIKYYAKGEWGEMNRLIINNSKYSSYMMFIIALPVFIEIRYLLYLWLGHVPEYTIVFTRLVLIQIMIQAIDLPIGTGIHAFGKMKLPNLTSSIAYLSILPISYVFMKMGASPAVAYIVIVCVYPVALVCDLLILHKYSGFPIRTFLTEVCLKTLLLIGISALAPLAIYNMMNEDFMRLVLVSLSSFMISCLVIYRIGLDQHKRVKVVRVLQNKLSVLLPFRKNVNV